MTKHFEAAVLRSLACTAFDVNQRALRKRRSDQRDRTVSKGGTAVRRIDEGDTKFGGPWPGQPVQRRTFHD
ncbi:MAG: hypothetical protein J4F97_06865, partial [Pseudomonadales bacterium]|nr:hypothetical protein [Pseudomonadales bacterium]